MLELLLFIYQAFGIPWHPPSVQVEPIVQTTYVYVSPKPVPTPVTPQPAAAPRAVFSSGGSAWERLADCETGDINVPGSANWSANTGNGYYGGLQFNLSTWRSNGGTGYPHQASKQQQIAIGQRLHAARGWAPWPGCARKLGLS